MIILHDNIFIIFLLLQNCSGERDAFDIRFFSGYLPKAERKRRDEFETRFDKSLETVLKMYLYFLTSHEFYCWTKKFVYNM